MGRSGVIPGWKVKRELVRFGQQLHAIPEFFWEPIAQYRHNRAARVGFSTHDGALAQGPKIALILVYQPNGVAPATIAMCAHLHARGYAPFVVSNAPLSPQDRTALAPVTWRMLERPNFGYDFGGYRDGILQLLRWNIVPDRLLIFNDSIWFPLTPNETLLTELEASSADLTGTILRERGAERFLESYCYMIPRATFLLPAFQAFWRDLALTSNKYKVIRRGERGFSRAMIAAGLSVVGLYTQAAFMAKVTAQNDGFLANMLRHSTHFDPMHEASRQALLSDAGSVGWRDRMLGQVRATLAREQVYAAYPYAFVQLFNYPILKKSNDRSAMMWRKAYLAAIEAGDLAPPSEPFLADLRCKTAADRL